MRSVCVSAVALIALLGADALAARSSSRNVQMGSLRERMNGGTSMGTTGAVPNRKLERTSDGRVKLDFGSSSGAAPAEARGEKVARVIFEGEESGWGVARGRMPYYSLAGKNQGVVKAGLRFSYNEVKHGKSGDFLVAVFVSSPVSGRALGPYLVDPSRAVVFSGDPETLDPQLLARISDYYASLEAYAERKREIEAKYQETCPHFVSCELARSRYRASVEKAAKLEKQMNALTGSRRDQVQEEMRTLKYEQTELLNAKRAAERKVKEWKSAHPIASQILEKDEKLLKLSQNIEEFRRDASFMSILPPEPEQ